MKWGMSGKTELPSESIGRRFAWFAAWAAVVVGGFAYVSSVLCDRVNPFHSGNGSSADLVVIVLLSPLLFFLGPRQNWRPAEVSAVSVLRWNGLCFVLPFFLALHWESVGGILGVRFSLKSADLGSLDARAAVVAAVALPAVVGLVVCHLVWAKRRGILGRYLGALLGIPCGLAIATVLLGDGYYLHVHHYCVGAFLFPFFCFRRVISLVAQGFFLGLAVEGVSRWEADPLWYALG